MQQFKYPGSIINEVGSRIETVSRAAQTMASVVKKKHGIYLKSKISQMRALALLIYLYAFEYWPLTTELLQRILV